jgi:hypothetical protein
MLRRLKNGQQCLICGQQPKAPLWFSLRLPVNLAVIIAILLFSAAPPSPSGYILPLARFLIDR